MADRMRSLALTANAACVETARMVAQVATQAWWEAGVNAAGGGPARLRLTAAPPTSLDLPDRIVAQATSFGRNLATLPLIRSPALLRSAVLLGRRLSATKVVSPSP